MGTGGAREYIDTWGIWRLTGLGIAHTGMNMETGGARYNIYGYNIVITQIGIRILERLWILLLLRGIVHWMI